MSHVFQDTWYGLLKDCFCIVICLALSKVAEKAIAFGCEANNLELKPSPFAIPIPHL
jgi:hypothetical protein